MSCAGPKGLHHLRIVGKKKLWMKRGGKHRFKKTLVRQMGFGRAVHFLIGCDYNVFCGGNCYGHQFLQISDNRSKVVRTAKRKL